MNTTTRFAATNARSATNQSSRHGNNNNTTRSQPNRSSPVPSNGAAASSNATASAATAGAPTMDSLDGLNVPTTATIPTLDPTSQAGLMQVPVTKTYDTKGRTEFFKGLLKKEVSLCCLFQKGRCHAADKCHQIHVEGAFIRNVRAQNAHVISCCRQCKDTASLSANAITFFATHFGDEVKIVSPTDGRYNTVPTVNVAVTIGLTQHVESMTKANPNAIVSTIPAKKMCRLHLRGACKYGKDCKNVHLCSKLGEGVLNPTSVDAISVTTTASSSRAPTPTPALVAAPAVASINTARRNSGIMDRASSAATVSASSSFAARRNSTSSTVSSSDAPKDYFSEQRFQTPPPAAPTATAVCSIDEQEDCLAVSTRPLSSPSTTNATIAPTSTLESKPRRLSFSQVDISNASFMLDHSVSIPELSFDPALALGNWDDVENSKQSQASKAIAAADWLRDDMCGCSSTTSQKSPTPTPSKMMGW